MSELRIKRGKYVVIVRPNGRGGWDVSASGGDALNAVEINQIAAFGGDGEEAERLVAKLRAKQ